LRATSARSKQRVHGLAAASADVQQVGHQAQVLLAGEQVVHGGELAGDADGGADRVGVRGQVVPRDPNLPGVGLDQGRQDLHGGGLAGAVGAEQREDGARRDGEVDAVQDEVVAVGLAQSGDGYGRFFVQHSLKATLRSENVSISIASIPQVDVHILMQRR
jgi:hypothetical protein